MADTAAGTASGTGGTDGTDGTGGTGGPAKGSRVSGDERGRLAAELRSRYEAGESIRVLAASSGRSYGFVHRILSESGVELRGRGGAVRRTG